MGVRWAHAAESPRATQGPDGIPTPTPAGGDSGGASGLDATAQPTAEAEGDTRGADGQGPRGDEAIFNAIQSRSCAHQIISIQNPKRRRSRCDRGCLSRACPCEGQIGGNARGKGISGIGIPECLRCGNTCNIRIQVKNRRDIRHINGSNGVIKITRKSPGDARHVRACHPIVEVGHHIILPTQRSDLGTQIIGCKPARDGIRSRRWMAGEGKTGCCDDPCNGGRGGRIGENTGTEGRTRRQHPSRGQQHTSSSSRQGDNGCSCPANVS